MTTPCAQYYNHTVGNTLHDTVHVMRRTFIDILRSGATPLRAPAQRPRHVATGNAMGASIRMRVERRAVACSRAYLEWFINLY